MSSFQVENLFNVKDKVVLVTGGSRGIGKMVNLRPSTLWPLLMFVQIATGFIRNGAKVSCFTTCGFPF